MPRRHRQLFGDDFRLQARFGQGGIDDEADNEARQGERFDADGAYVRRWCPELARVPDKWVHRPWEAPTAVLQMAGVRLGRDYPAPILDHAAARVRALCVFKALRATS